MLTLAGVLAGQMIYRLRQDIILTTLVTFVIAIVGIWASTLPGVAGVFTAVNGGDSPPILFGSVSQPLFIWALATMLFCYLGSVLPIWRWAQPINYVAFWIIALGMLGAVVSILVWHPTFGDFPAFTSFGIGIGPLWPILFVTIACGSISGWHSLVSSSGTARQLEKETDALPVAGGSMLAEMVLAVITVIVAASAFAGFAGYKDILAKGGGAVFASGLGVFLSHIGVPQDFGTAYGAVFLTIMALTVMQLVLRFMRVAGAEFMGEQVPVMKNAHVGSVIAIVLSGAAVHLVRRLQQGVHRRDQAGPGARQRHRGRDRHLPGRRGPLPGLGRAQGDVRAAEEGSAGDGVASHRLSAVSGMSHPV